MTGDAKVENREIFDPPTAQKQVRGLEIAVDHRRVRKAQGLGGLGQQRQRLRHGQAAALQSRMQIFAIEPLHHQEGLAVAAEAMVDVSDDAGVPQGRKQLGFAHEAVDIARLALIGPQQLDRHHLPRVPIQAAIDATHAAFPTREISSKRWTNRECRVCSFIGSAIYQQHNLLGRPEYECTAASRSGAAFA